MTSFLKFQLVIVSLIIAACGQEKKEPSKEILEVGQNKQKMLDSLNLIAAENLSKTSNAITGWDTTYNFTYSLQESIEVGLRPVSFIGEIKDIIKKDSAYILKVVNTNPQSSKSFVAEISVTSTMFQTLKSKVNANQSNEGCFIFKVSRVSSHLPILKSEIESNGDNMEDASSYLTLNFEGSLIKLEGKLITYFFYDSLKDSDE